MTVTEFGLFSARQRKPIRGSQNARKNKSSRRRRAWECPTTDANGAAVHSNLVTTRRTVQFARFKKGSNYSMSHETKTNHKKAREEAVEFQRRSPQATTRNFSKWVRRQPSEWLTKHAGYMVAFRSEDDVVVAPTTARLMELVPDVELQWYLLTCIPGESPKVRHYLLLVEGLFALRDLATLSDGTEVEVAAVHAKFWETMTEGEQAQVEQGIESLKRKWKVR